LKVLIQHNLALFKSTQTQNPVTFKTHAFGKGTNEDLNEGNVQD